MVVMTIAALAAVACCVVATCLLATLLPDEVARSSARNGRHAYLGEPDEVSVPDCSPDCSPANRPDRGAARRALRSDVTARERAARAIALRQRVGRLGGWAMASRRHSR